MWLMDDGGWGSNGSSFDCSKATKLRARCLQQGWFVLQVLFLPPRHADAGCAVDFLRQSVLQASCMLLLSGKWLVCGCVHQLDWCFTCCTNQFNQQASLTDVVMSLIPVSDDCCGNGVLFLHQLTMDHACKYVLLLVPFVRQCFCHLS
jgi:hypothetical protein